MNDALETALRTAEEIVLETRGRQSGRPHRVTIWFAYDGTEIWLRTDRESDWFRNLERDPACRVTAGGVTADARRSDATDAPADLQHAVALWRAKYGQDWVEDWYFERGRVVVRLRLTSA